MRRRVRAAASIHWAALNFRVKPVSRAATKTPVPAADNQFTAKTAPSGLAFGSATGGMRCTRLCNAGICQAGSERVPANFEPSSVVLIFTPAKSALRKLFQAGMPQAAQQRISIAHGVHAYAVWPRVYGYSHSLAGCVTPPAFSDAAASALRSDLRRKRVFGCQTKRRKRAVQITENTPDTTSVIRWKAWVWEARNCMMAKDAPETRVAGHTSQASFNLPPCMSTKVVTSQKGMRMETKGSCRPAAP